MLRLCDLGIVRACKVQDTITALNTQYVNAINQDNVNSVMELYDNDCVMMLEGFETISGKSRTQPYVAKMIGDVTTVTFTSQEVTPMDDAADYVYQRSKFSGQNANGKVVYDGKSLMIWKKNDSSYKIHIHMYNSDS
ncbi:uncharacterized protein LOC110980129 isoform X2 [Acanthaster planci]|uniref:Uncharacterized protein LOC110980129 isoform X2 n=1 Tax=Acanthaster planci TaxID=133434 RepID=A0A8B7YIG4_ACAPL|nr:uncharacterized protein LOC110980129 isoform X2 [Acanthaster planci]